MNVDGPCIAMHTQVPFVWVVAQELHAIAALDHVLVLVDAVAHLLHGMATKLLHAITAVDERIEHPLTLNM